MSKIIRYITDAPAVCIGDNQLDTTAESSAESKLGQLFPVVSVITNPDGAKLIPIMEVAKLEQILNEESRKARKEGYDDGFQKGLDKGLDEARQVLKRFEGAISDAVGQRASILEDAKQKILELVLQISQKVTFDALDINREATIDMIEGVINNLVDRSQLRIKVHPDYLPLVEQNMDRFLSGSTAIKDLKFEADPRVRLGGCFIETPTGDIDARLESQFDVIADTLQADGGDS
ncbi:MAG: hypothetical protein GY867_00350 [bacterium]|nr:hypothetical protein [bacterium]